MSLDTAPNTASFTPGSNLTPGIVCTATLTTDIKSSAGTALAADYVWTFTTGPVADVTAPTVVSTSPVDTDIGVLLDQNITTIFDEALDPSTVDAISFTLAAGAGATVIAGSVSYANLVATFNPDSNLVASTLFLIADTPIPIGGSMSNVKCVSSSISPRRSARRRRTSRHDSPDSPPPLRRARLRGRPDQYL